MGNPDAVRTNKVGTQGAYGGEVPYKRLVVPLALLTRNRLDFRLGQVGVCKPRLAHAPGAQSRAPRLATLARNPGGDSDAHAPGSSVVPASHSVRTICNRPSVGAAPSPSIVCCRSSGRSSRSPGNRLIKHHISHGPGNHAP